MQPFKLTWFQKIIINIVLRPLVFVDEILQSRLLFCIGHEIISKLGINYDRRFKLTYFLEKIDRGF